MDPDARSRSPVFRLGASLASASAMAERGARRVRLWRASIAVALSLCVGTWGYWYLSDGSHTVVQALYMTVISISTVGFNEVIPIRDDTMRVFTMTLILGGGASVVYFLTAIAAYVLEGDFLYGFWRRRLRAQLGHVREHVIVCGLGRLGSHTFAELHRSNTPVVGIDREPSRVENLMNVRGPGILFMVGDAADEQVLRELGVERARMLVAALSDDRDNFLLCVTARQINPDVGLMVRLVDPSNSGLFDGLAADAVVHPPALSGVRLANELLLPELTEFTDRMLESDAQVRSLSEVVIPAHSPLIGQRVAALLPKDGTGVLVLGVRSAVVPPDAAFAFGPAAERRIEAGDTLYVLAARAAHKRMLALIAGKSPRHLRILPRKREPAVVRQTFVVDESSPALPGRGHVVVAGAGAVGRSAVRELLRHGAEVVVIDRSEQRLALLEPHPRLTLLRGDVGDKAIQDAADLGGALGFITALQPLRDNLFLAASVHRNNPHARVVARAGSDAEARRLRAVGAAAVNPGRIGGVHMAHRMMRPELVEFAHGLEESWSHSEQLAVVPITTLPPGVRKLGALRVHVQTGCVILGYRARTTGPFAYHPAPDTRLRVGGAFVALGEPSHIVALYSLVGPAGPVEATPAPIPLSERG